MELQDVVRLRRMTRRYDNSVRVRRDLLDRLVDAGLRAPSAGFSQGYHFLVLDEPAAVARYWNVTASVGPPDSWLTGMMTAPVLVVVYSDRSAYERRYAEPDKQIGVPAGTDPTGDPTPLSVTECGVLRRNGSYPLEQRWPVPYWDVDAGMAALLIQLAAVDAGLGCCWFAVPTERVAVLAAAFGVPSTMTPVGVISLGYPRDGGAPSPSTRRRRPRVDMVSYGEFDGVAALRRGGDDRPAH